MLLIRVENLVCLESFSSSWSPSVVLQLSTTTFTLFFNVCADNSQFIYFVLVIFFVSRVSIVSGRALFCIDLVMFMYYLFLMLEVETGTFLGLIVL